MKLHHRSEGLELWQGGAAGIAAELAPGSVQTVVTSPPYFGLRDYGIAGQLGGESDVREFVANLVVALGEVRRVLADDGVLWLNLGDTYSGSGKGARSDAAAVEANRKHTKESYIPTRAMAPLAGKIINGIPAKSLLGIPWRVALACIDDGWILRNEVIWHKPNPMPEPVRDRLTRSHEHIFMLTKKPRYYFDPDAVAEPAVDMGRSTRNRRDVWAFGTQPFPGAHFATFPPELPRICIRASSRPGDLVLDPFSGSGTTGMVALEEGRRYVGVDLNPDYLDLSLETRFKRSRESA